MELKINKVLVPIDFSDYSKSSLKYAVNFAKLFKAHLSLVYVVEPVVYPPDFSMGQIAIPSINVDVIVKTGKPFIEIIETAKEENVDLIIIATHGHTGMEHILFGSTAEKVVRKAPCPVLTLRDPSKGFNYKEHME